MSGKTWDWEAEPEVQAPQAPPATPELFRKGRPSLEVPPRWPGMVQAACNRIASLSDGRRIEIRNASLNLAGYLHLLPPDQEPWLRAQLVDAGIRSGTANPVEPEVDKGIVNGKLQPHPGWPPDSPRVAQAFEDTLPGRPDPTGGVRKRIEQVRANGSVTIPPTLGRACAVLSEDPRWVDRVRRNELTDETTIDDSPLTDDAVLDTARWLEREYSVEWGKDKVRDALVSVADGNRYDPIREYLAGLPEWDGVPRLDRLMVDYFGASDGPLVAAYGRCTMVAMVARTMEPGVKVDHVLTLQGPQGWRKSSGLAALCPNAAWFADDAVPFEDPKRLGMVLRGRWLIEFADFAGVKRADTDEVKSCLTRGTDKYVPMHGHCVVTQPRRVVFVASVNDDAFLLDAGRRWWVVAIARMVDVDAIRRDRDQLWAEALHRYQAGERWHLPPALEALQAVDVQRYAVRNPTVDLIAEWWAGHLRVEDQRFGLSELWDRVHQHAGWHDRHGAVRVPTMAEQRGFGQALREAGWSCRKGRGDPGNRWYPPSVGAS